jgi:hypothetical protein
MLSVMRLMKFAGRAVEAVTRDEAPRPASVKRVLEVTFTCDELRLSADQRQARAVLTPAAGPSSKAVQGAAILADLQSGKADEATRARIAAYFGPAGMAESRELMAAIRKAGLLDAFLDATLRNAEGGPVAPELRDAVRHLMETGRLDVYAETLATTSINHYDPADGRFGGNTVYSPGDKGVFFNGLGEPAEMAKTMAHELFHAYNDAHGADGAGPGVTGAMNEGFGVAAIGYAFEPDRPINIAEMIYGTKNFYRDIGVSGHDNDIPLGDATNADPELLSLLESMAGHDLSDVAWNDPEQLQAEYDQFFAPINRMQDWNAWLAEVEEATRRMRAARV